MARKQLPSAANAPASDLYLECPWNDHGYICGRRGSLSDSMNGAGPWYCSEHYAKLKGWSERKSGAAPMSYRERWYLEQGKDYEPPKSGNLGTATKVRQREPGEDSPEDIGYENASA